MENFRQFEVRDLFGRLWHVEYLWGQNAISIRHADAVDVKFDLTADDGERQTKVIALPHPLLESLSREANRPVTDAWCARLAAGHLKHMLQTGEDLDKTLVTVGEEALRR